jgi:DnaJ-domain-containing protein 1
VAENGAKPERGKGMEIDNQVDFELFSIRQDTSEAMQAIDPIHPGQSGGFVDDIQQFLGANSEPDSIFFIECWTVGASSAIENLEQRLLKEANRAVQSPTFHEFDILGSQFFVHENMRIAEELRSTQNAGRSMSSEWLLAQTRSAYSQEGGAFAEGFSKRHDAALPMTQDLARRILGVFATSTPGQIRAAYRRMVRMWHPDRLEYRAEEMREIATEKMSAINEAYHLLHSGFHNPA